MEQDTYAKMPKYKHDKMQKYQNTNTKYKLPKYKCNERQMQQNTNGTRYK